jgi:hypothetical protein
MLPIIIEMSAVEMFRSSPPAAAGALSVNQMIEVVLCQPRLPFTFTTVLSGNGKWTDNACDLGQVEND